MEPAIQIEQALASVRALAAKANALVAEDFDHYHQHGERPEHDNDQATAEAIETSLLQLMNLAEALRLRRLCRVIDSTHQQARARGLSKKESFEDQSAWSYWSGPVERLADSIAAIYGLQQRVAGAISTDLLSLLQNMQSAVTDKRCFGPPKDEAEVHDRIEAVLRCVYPDLVRKPLLSKAVAGFVPDSGIPSINTLIEYKFLSNDGQARQIANEILADTRGYYSRDWQRIIFVVYETLRFKTVHEWRQLLRDCGVAGTVAFVLLHGEPAQPKRPQLSIARAKKSTRKAEP